MSVKKNLTRTVSLVLVVASLLMLCTGIVHADEREGITVKSAWKKVDGEIYSYAEGSYYSTSKMPNNIATLEAWIYIPKSNYSFDCGVYFGNYAGLDNDAYVTYEVLKNGVPCLTFGDTDKTVNSYPFTDAVIPADTWTHVTVVYGAGRNYKDIYCYINGERKHTYTDDSWATMQKTVIDNYFSIAGDSRSLNTAHFTGSLGDIAVYKDVRTDAYIKNDMTSPNYKDKSLMAYYPLFECENKQNVPDAQWKIAKAQTDRLDGIVPYTVMRGNHDTTYNEGAEIFDELYSVKDGYYYNFVKENGGFYDENSVKNVYLLFSVGNVDYMILSLDFGASGDIVLWANRLLKQYPDRRVIITTHAYLYVDGTTLSTGDAGDPNKYEHYLDADYVNGDELWGNLVYNNPNVAMLACGHMHSDAVLVTEAEGYAKNTVYQVLVDAQTTDSNLDGAGLVAMMYFTENGEFATFEYYSPVFEAYFCAERCAGVLQFPTPKEEITDAPAASPDVDSENNQYMTLILLSSAVLVVCAATLGTIFAVKSGKKKKKI